MSTELDAAVKTAISSYESDVARIVTDHGDLLDALIAEVAAAGGVDALSDHFFGLTDDLKANLGSSASNELGGAAVQEAAISSMEAWVTENVANGDLRDNVLCAMVMEGPETAAESIRAEIAASAPRP